MPTQTPQQLQNSLNAAGYNPQQQGQVLAGQQTTAPTTPTPQLGNITSNTLSSQPSAPSTQPDSVPNFNIQGLPSTASASPYDSLTGPQQQEQGTRDSIQQLNDFLAGKADYQTQQYKTLGIGMTYDSNGNIVPDAGTADLQGKLDALKTQALAIPLQDQQGANGLNGTQAGVQATDVSRSRQNSIDALGISAQISARNGQLVTAQHYVDNATIQKFGPAEAQLKAQTANLNQIINSPDYTNAEKKQAADAQLQNQEKLDAIATAKQNYQDAQTQALTYASVATPSQMQQLQAGKTPLEVATIATQLGISSPAQQKILADLEIQKAQIANLPLDKQLKQAQVLDAQAGARLKQAQAAAMSNPVQSNGLVAGATGSSTIDPTTQGYSSTPVAGGLTQASIDQKALYYVTSGTMPPQGRTGIAGLQNMAISNRMAELGNNTNLAANKTVLKSYSTSLDKQQTYLDTTQRAFDTANQNLTALTGYMTSANINTASNIPLINSLNNSVKAGVTDPGVISGYRAAIAGLRAEYAQVLSRGGEVTEGQRSQANSLIPDNLTPAQLQQVADRLNVEGTNAVNEAQGQITTIQGKINGIIQPTMGSDQYASYRSQVPTGDILINRGGQIGHIPSSELLPTDKKL